MIRLPKKFKNVFMQVDNRGEWLYALVVEGNKIVNLYPMQKEIPYVVLPVLEAQPYKPTNLDITGEIHSEEEKNYINGQMIIDEYAFSDIKKTKIILPQETSVRIEPTAFDADADIEFILPENFDMKTITTVKQTYGTPTFPKHHILIADKNLIVQTFGNPWYESNPYNSNIVNARCSVNKKMYVKDCDIKFFSNKIEKEEASIE